MPYTQLAISVNTRIYSYLTNLFIVALQETFARHHRVVAFAYPKWTQHIRRGDDSATTSITSPAARSIRLPPPIATRRVSSAVFDMVTCRACNPSSEDEHHTHHTMGFLRRCVFASRLYIFGAVCFCKGNARIHAHNTHVYHDSHVCAVTGR